MFSIAVFLLGITYISIKCKRKPVLLIGGIENTKYEDWIYFAFVFMLLGILFIVLFDQNLGLSLFALGIACISIALGTKAIQLGKESDKKMKNISNMEFLDIIDKFEDQRLLLYRYRESPYVMELTAWKCRSYAEWAINVQKSVKKDYKELLIRHYIKLIENTFPWKGHVYYDAPTDEKPINRIEIKEDKIAFIDVKNLIITYQNLRKLDNVDDSKRDEPIKLLEKHVDERKKIKGKIEDIDDYLDRKNSDISEEIKLKGKRAFFKKAVVEKKSKKEKKMNKHLLMD